MEENAKNIELVFQDYREQVFINNKKKNTLLIIGIIVVLIILSFIGLMTIHYFKNKNNNNNVLGEDLFFISNDEQLSALFNKNGKKLTNFIYKTSYLDISKYGSVIQNTENEYGIIKQNGEMLESFGICKYIFTYGPLFNCIDEDNISHIINTNGEEILSGEDIKGINFNDNDYAIILKNKKYLLYDSDGILITSIKVENISNPDNPIVVRKDNFIQISNKEKHFFIDTNLKKVIHTISSEGNYKIGDINKSKNAIIIWKINDPVNDIDYIYVHNNITFITKNHLTFLGDNVYDNTKNAILDGNGNIIIDATGKYIIDQNNYAEVNNKNGINIYYNGNMITTVKCSNIKLYNDIYELSYCEKTGYYTIFYKKDGTKVNEELYEKTSEFLDNGISIVSKDGHKYFLLDQNGNRKSKDYDKISAYKNDNNKYYYAKDSNQNYIISLSGEELIKYDNTADIYDDKYAIIENKDGYSIFDLENKKNIVTSLNSKPDLNTNYFITKDDSKIQYYSYITGKMFYEKNNSI